MAIFHAHVKMVSFRLSEVEYQQALEACLAQGVRSVSALARQATLNASQPSGAVTPVPATTSTDMHLRGVAEQLCRAALLLVQTLTALEDAAHQPPTALSSESEVHS